jgi:hypothetical protein
MAAHAGIDHEKCTLAAAEFGVLQECAVMDVRPCGRMEIGRAVWRKAEYAGRRCECLLVSLDPRTPMLWVAADRHHDDVGPQTLFAVAAAA